MRIGRFAIGLGATLVAAVMIAVLAARAPGMSGAALPAPRFVEEAAVAGIEHRYDGEFDFFVGGGVAVFDCDDDGRQDLYLAGGELPASLYRNQTPIGGRFRFARQTDEQTDLLRVTGAYPLDVDSDRVADLAVRGRQRTPGPRSRSGTTSTRRRPTSRANVTTTPSSDPLTVDQASRPVRR
jgi:hypothetical protein